MDEFNSSGSWLSAGFLIPAGISGSWITILLRFLLMALLALKLLFSSFTVEAAELGSYSDVSGGDYDGTLDITPDDTQPDAPIPLPSASPDANLLDDSAGDSYIPPTEIEYDTYEEFMESPLYVTRYENEILKKLEYCQYAFAIIIALLFLLIFKRK